MTAIHTITPRVGLRVEVAEWVHREEVATHVGIVNTITEHTITINVESDSSRRSFLREDVTVHQPWDERRSL